ncbi:hypothetical protein POSPLADRAFT_1171012 [Postia placenta MAD-698-R-SB12]|uniref:Peptidase A1 domain-containing protein n=1 Tax=Postia placenta MAD-698-R-SB12 TaxID=670580 RepID=A0A1X6MY89_9APHY|nr:hypothetical protein POSPLADRAFT_1171012 [Postia placenta MAD-698-R-SB12]OSX61338.1 hypothetical protein POSPLADRAFT_1171012 [Postia placenta MAD-698-R-SB12]
MLRCLTLSAVLAAVSLSAVNATTIDLKPINGKTGAYMKGAADAHRARAAILKRNAGSNDISIPATNLEYMQYTASIGVGNPPTYYELVIDTGSSNTFVGTGKPYVRTNTSISTGQPVNVTYGTGFFSGYEFYDQVTIAPDFVITNQSIGNAINSSSFEGVDGIIGVGPVDLTQFTLATEPNATIPTVLDNALAQGLISQQVLGVSFAPADSNSSINGKLTFGGADDELYFGDIAYTPITSTFPASLYWGVNVSATYGLQTIIPDSYAGIVDTGTTLIYIADDWYQSYLDAIPGSYYDSNTTGLTVIPHDQADFLAPFTVMVAGQPLILDAAAQLLPKDQNEVWGGEKHLRYGYIGPMGSDSGKGLDFIIGQKFMERFYAVFDQANSRVGFAYTNHTFSLP